MSFSNEIIGKIPAIGRTCPNCGSTNSPAVVNTDLYTMLSTTNPGKGSPSLIMVVCQDCGLVRLFDKRTVNRTL